MGGRKGEEKGREEEEEEEERRREKRGRGGQGIGLEWGGMAGDLYAL